MSQIDLKIPNIGDFKDVEVIEVLVENGQEIKKNEPLITIESDKSSVEIPSTSDGKVISLNVKVGDKVSEGDKILKIKIPNNEILNNEISNNNETEPEKKEYFEKKSEDSKKEIKSQNLIVRNFSSKTSASPKVRKFARELGVDISKVYGSERQGRVTESDIKLFVATLIRTSLN